jgi:NADPH:quinone reductase-like Zn-dependent oxidoreductase
MKAAVISAYGDPPRFAEFDNPIAVDGEVLVHVTAAGLHPVVRALASGEHYGSQGMLPMVPGVDGTGRLSDGARVYFGAVRSPFGTMAELAAAPRSFCIPLPDPLDDITAAAIINPGLAAWLALTRRARLRPRESVLVLGATGASGRIAVTLARHLGAERVLAAGRNPGILDTLDATVIIRLGAGDDAHNLAEAIGESGVDVIIDYLWGSPTEAAIRAISRRGLTHTAPRVRLIDVGQAAGPTLTLPADVLRSSGLEIIGSGAGTIPLEDIVEAIPEFMTVAATVDLPIDLEEVPLAQVHTAWQRADDGRRIVFRAEGKIG